MTLRDEYERLCRTPSDIYEHLPTFIRLASDLEAAKIIELGTRTGVSTVAWLWALEQTGGHLWSVDLDPPPTLGFDAPRWTFLRGDDLDPTVVGQLPDDADIVFIDTSHGYADTLAELHVYRYKVRAGGRIVLHDTELRKPQVRGVQPDWPVKRAVVEFCADEQLTWENDPRCFGLGTITIEGDPWR